MQAPGCCEAPFFPLHQPRLRLAAPVADAEEMAVAGVPAVAGAMVVGKHREPPVVAAAGTQDVVVMRAVVQLQPLHLRKLRRSRRRSTFG